MANTLFLRLEGPMQSWGERGRWRYRDTAPEPTKSGIVGLLGCSLGISQDEELVVLSRHIRLGIRCDQPGEPITDYHTVMKGSVTDIISRRVYLCDASFLAAVQTGDDWVARLADAVRDPIWPVYLGRKSCPPAAPIFAGVGDFPNLEAALRAGLAEDVSCRAVIECRAEEGALRHDEIDSNRRRTFLPRYTRDVWLSGEAAAEEGK